MKILILYLLFQFILAQDTLILINDKVITKNDFIKRAEYTIRPNYCKSNNNIDKKIILNSLIAEKLFAIENSTSQIEDNQTLNFITGIKEQAMRRVMLEEYVNENLSIKDDIITNLYNNSQFEYQTDFIVLKSDKLKEINFNNSFYEIAKQSKSIPSSKDINFFTCSNNDIWSCFYKGDKIDTGDLIGPIKLSSDESILISVVGKKKNVILDRTSQIEHYSKVKDFYTQIESSKLRESLILNLMNGKQIEFDRKIFFNLADYYYDNKTDIKVNTQDVLFRLNNNDWKIEDIIDINTSHPLVFRDSYSNKDEFYNQFKLALVDLVRDYFITNKAFDQNYQNHPAVIKEVDIWKDYSLAIDKRNQIINNHNASKNYTDEYYVIKDILSKESDLLFNKYSDKIIIDVDMFNEIQLTRIDMMVINVNHPYQLTVPPFPKLTIKNNLNYGMKKPT